MTKNQGAKKTSKYDYERGVAITRAFGRTDYMYVYEVAPWAYRTLTDRIAVAIEEAIDLSVDVDNWPTDYPDAAVLAKLIAGIPVTNFPADYPDSAVATKLAGGLPAALDGLSLKVKEQSPITTIDVTDEASRLLGEVDNLKKWGGTALTGRDISLDFAKLTDIETNTDGLLKTADLSLEAITKHLAVDVQNYPATYPDTDIEPRNISKIGGTAQTGADWTPLLQKLDVALSTKARLQPWYQPNFTTSNQHYEGYNIAPHNNTVRWTYTVPANRIAIVRSAFGFIGTSQAATTPEWASLFIAINNTCRILDEQFLNNTVGVTLSHMVGESALLVAGDTLKCTTTDGSSGATPGHKRYIGSANIIEFNV